jgi:hypothetical protein
LYPSIALTARRTGKWTEDEDSQLHISVQTHNCKNWAAIAVLVPGRTKMQCFDRWRNTLDPSIALTAGRVGQWGEDEDIKLKMGETHGEKGQTALFKIRRLLWGGILTPLLTGNEFMA